MPEEVAILIMIAMLGGFSLSGLSMILKARGRRHREVGREEVDRLTDAVETLHDQVYQLRDSMAELHERVDFAERLLTKGGKEG
jgi:hypothetical protein